MHINCDIGERGAEHPIDRELMNYINMANIACGGHAGDEKSIEVFLSVAAENGIAVSAHLSYPDRENFGRTSMNMPRTELLKSLETQYRMIGDVKAVKFHGALYNDCWINTALAADLADWLKETGIQTVITPYQSELAKASLEQGMSILYEAFAERRYAYHPESDRLTLVSRTLDYASIHNIDEAVSHAGKILRENQVDGHIAREDGSVELRSVTLKADTICIHSDSPISLELAARLAALGEKE